MNEFRLTICLLAMGLTAPVAAIAQAPSATSAAPATSTQIPEPGDVALFLLGVTGLIVGRGSSRARNNRADP